MTDYRHTVAIDFDGTIVEHKWPDVGDPTHGMEAAIREIQKVANPVVFSCRVAPFEMDGYTPRSPALVQHEVDKITHVLERHGLYDIPVWTKPWKPLAVAYIDDRAVPYSGRKNSWNVALQRTLALIHAQKEIG